MHYLRGWQSVLLRFLVVINEIWIIKKNLIFAKFEISFFRYLEFNYKIMNPVLYQEFITQAYNGLEEEIYIYKDLIAPNPAEAYHVGPIDDLNANQYQILSLPQILSSYYASQALLMHWYDELYPDSSIDSTS